MLKVEIIIFVMRRPLEIISSVSDRLETSQASPELKYGPRPIDKLDGRDPTGETSFWIRARDTSDALNDVRIRGDHPGPAQGPT